MPSKLMVGTKDGLNIRDTLIWELGEQVYCMVCECVCVVGEGVMVYLDGVVGN